MYPNPHHFVNYHIFPSFIKNYLVTVTKQCSFHIIFVTNATLESTLFNPVHSIVFCLARISDGVFVWDTTTISDQTPGYCRSSFALLPFTL